ncbi:MAG: Fic family protein, partial [Hungatella sp.]
SGGIYHKVQIELTYNSNHMEGSKLSHDQTRYIYETLIKLLHSTLKSGTSDSRKDWFAVGAYKRLPNEVGGKETTAPEDVSENIHTLLKEYNKTKVKTFSEIIDFHDQFESIHPFQDGNGRVGRLILFKECLRNGIVPFIIDDELKMFYYRGLQNWKSEKGFLTDTCLSAQDKFKKYLDYFRIKY